MKQLIQEIVFKKLLKDTGIEPAQIEVIDPIIVTPESNVQRFYKWMLRCENKYVGNTEMMTKAFHKVYISS